MKFGRSKSSREDSFQGTKVLGTLLGAKFPKVNFRSKERKYQGAKSDTNYYQPS